MNMLTDSWLRVADAKRIRLTSVAFAVAGLLAACSGSGATSAPSTPAPTGVAPSAASSEAAPSAAANLSVAFSQAHLSDPFQQVLLEQLQVNATAAGAAWAGAANANDDPAKQVADISTLLAKNPSGLLISPVDAKAIIPAIDAATAQKVPVVSIDQAPAGGKVTMVVRADNLKMGDTACQEMGKLLNGQGTVLELQGDLASANGLQRSQGFGDCMKAKFANIKIVQVPTVWNMEKATTGAQTILSTQKIDGIYWASDYFLPGIQKVLQDVSQWKKVGETGHIAIVGIDGAADALGLIRDGYQDATVSQPLDLYAKYGVLYALGAAQGKTWTDGPTDHNSTIVTTDGIPADNLTAPLVTKDNVDDATLWANMVKK
jgi:ABC-type sugar transport system substrate-binding protein